MKKSVPYFIVLLALLLIKPGSAQTWDPTGPNGANIVSIKTMPSYLVAAAYNASSPGGVWLSDNDGLTWDNITGNLENKKVIQMWTTEDTIYLSIEPRNISGQWQDDGGVFRSADNGGTWIRILATNYTVPKSYLNHGNVMYFGRYGGISRSFDHGATWDFLTGGQTGTSKNVNCFENCGDTIIIGTANRIFRSINNCSTWTLANNGFPTAIYARTVTGMTKVGSTLYAASQTSGVFKSSDRGDSWIAVNNGLTDLNIRSVYSDGTNLYAGTYTNGLFKSTDGGNNWVTANQGLSNEIIWDLLQSEGIIFAGGQNGIYKSTDLGSSWTEANTGLAGHMIGSGQSNIVESGNYLFAGSYMGSIFRSANNGDTWHPITGEIRTGTSLPYITAIGANQSAIIASTYNAIYRSTDWGDNWEVASFPSSSKPKQMITANNRIFASNMEYLYFTDDGGSNWQQDDGPMCTLVCVKGNDVFISGYQFDTHKVYMSVNGVFDTLNFNYMGEVSSTIGAIIALGDTLFVGVNGQGIYKSFDNGVTWIFDGLSGKSISGFTRHGTTLFAREQLFNNIPNSEFNLYVRNNDNGTWISINSDLPFDNQGWYGSALFANDSTLFASVSSRSLYKADVSQFTVPSQPEPIIGNASPCIGSTEIYSVPNTSGVTYTWEFPADWTIISGQTTNSVTVTVGSFPGTVIVTPSNFMGSGPNQLLVVIPSSPEPAEVSITADNNPSCPGSEVNYTATPINGGNPSYQWYVNDVSVGTDQPTYSYIPDNNDQVYVVMTSDLTCISDNPATSDTITMVVSDLNPVSVSITADQNNVCESTIVNFLAIPVAGGDAPVYQWYVNGTFAGNGETYSYSPSDGDQVFVIMTSSLECTTGNPAVSNLIQMQVSPYIDVTASIAITQNNLCEGSQFNFTSSTTGGGNTPQYQWQVNGATTGENTPEFAYVAENGDVVSMVFTSDLTCTNGNPVTSNTITAVVNPLPIVTWPGFEPDTLCIEDWGPVTLNGGTPAGGTYSGDGVVDNLFDPAQAGTGTHEIIYTYSDPSGCSNQSSLFLFVDVCLGMSEKESGLLVYPNPVSDNLMVKMQDNSTLQQITLTNMLGIRVYQIENPDSNEVVSIPVQNLPSGNYLLRVISESKFAFKMVVIK